MVGYLSFLKIGPKLLKFLPGKDTGGWRGGGGPPCWATSTSRRECRMPGQLMALGLPSEPSCCCAVRSASAAPGHSHLRHRSTSAPGLTTGRSIIHPLAGRLIG